MPVMSHGGTADCNLYTRRVRDCTYDGLGLGLIQPMSAGGYGADDIARSQRARIGTFLGNNALWAL